MTARLRFDGWILGASFGTGHTLVFGRWQDSPFGSFADLMLREPDGTRVLIAPDDAVADFVDRHYRFDRIERAAVQVDREAGRIVADAGRVRLVLDLGPRQLVGHLLRMRPRVLRTDPRWIAVEDRVFRPIVAPLLGGGVGGIHARGVTRAGARQWYGIHDLLPARARATVDGRDLGAPEPPTWQAGFGASEFPGMPAAVRVTSLIEDLDREG